MGVYFDFVTPHSHWTALLILIFCFNVYDYVYSQVILVDCAVIWLSFMFIPMIFICIRCLLMYRLLTLLGAGLCTPVTEPGVGRAHPRWVGCRALSVGG